MLEFQKANPIKYYIYAVFKRGKVDLEKRFVKARIGITPLQYGILITLKPGALTLNDLAHQMEIRPPSLVAPVEDLAKQGFIKRETDRKDRRKIHLTATPKALQILKKISIDDLNDSVNQAIKKLSTAQKQQLTFLLEQLIKHLPKVK